MNIIKKTLAAAVSLIFVGQIAAQTIQLPAPNKTGGMPLMEALSARQSTRAGYVNEPLDKQTLADLLWAAYGFNRADKRTVPSAMNMQEFSIYVLTEDGAYLYDAKANTLTLVAKGSLKSMLAPQQAYVKDVPVHLAFVGDTGKSNGSSDALLMDVGYISQNVYLYAASKGLGTVARGSFDRAKLPQALKLKEGQSVVLVQAIGRVKK